MIDTPIRLHRVAELTPALMAELAAGGYRALRDPDLVIYIADSTPVTLGRADAAVAPVPPRHADARDGGAGSPAEAEGDTPHG